MKNKKYQTIDIGKSQLNIDLANGESILTHQTVNSDNNILPIGISHIYNKNIKTSNYGKGFNLNLNQELKKDKDNDGNEIYAYTDATREIHEFKELFYKLDSNNKRDYLDITREEVEIDLEGNLLYSKNGIDKEKIYSTFKTDSGLTLRTNQEGYKNSKLIETRVEDIANLEEEIIQLKEEINRLEFAKKKYDGEYNKLEYIQGIAGIDSLDYSFLTKENRKGIKTITDNLIKNNDEYNLKTGYELQPMSVIVYRSYNDPQYTIKKGEYYGYGCANAQTAQQFQFKSKESELQEEINKNDPEKTVFIKYNQQQHDQEIRKLTVNIKKDQDSLKKDFRSDISDYAIPYYNEKIRKYQIILNNKEYQLNEMKKQLPVNYIISGEIVLGFNEFGKVSMVFDNYENRVLVLYNDKDLIETIIDSNELQIELKYNQQDQLISIKDIEDRETKFEYNYLNLTKIIYPNEEEFIIRYQSGNIVEILNEAKIGCKLLYSNDKITTILKRTEYLSNQEVEILRIEYGNNTTRVLDAETLMTMFYFFDNDGNLITEYSQKDGEIQSITTIDKNDHCQNELTSTKNDKNIFYHKEKKVTSQAIFEITSFEDNVTDYILSAFAQANSATTLDRRKTKYCNHLNSSNQTGPRFELSCIVIYENNPSEQFIAPYDYSNKGRQFTALQIVFKEDQNGKVILPSKIQIILDYSSNQGECIFDNIKLTTGEYVYSEYDNCFNKVFECSNENISIKTIGSERVGKYIEKAENHYTYDDDNNLIEDKLVSTIEEYNIAGEIIDRKTDIYSTKYEYNKQNKQIRVIDEKSAMIEETIYNEKGLAIRVKKFHKDNSGLYFNSESEVNEKGQVLKVIDNLDNETNYEYEPNTNKVVKQTNSEEQTINYAYDYNTDNVTNINTSIDGKDNSNQSKYIKGFLTEQNNPNTKYNYTYDKYGQVKEIKINNETYVAYNEQKNSSTNIYQQEYSNRSGYEVVKDKYGKILRKQVLQKGLIIPQVNYTYDKNDKLIEENDLTNNNTKKYTYIDENLVKVEDGNYEKTIDTDVFKNNSRINYKYNDLTKSNYDYTYNKENQLEEVKHNNQTIEKFEYDKLGRVKKQINNQTENSYAYLTNNGHTTNLVNTVITKQRDKEERTKYTYDKLGNITEIKTSDNYIRYTYDKLSRLIREDNLKLNLSYQIEYDANGNIESKTNYKYSLKELENGQEIIYYYDNDKLIKYNNEPIEYSLDNLIGNPKLYRNKKLDWDIRNLVSIDNIKFEYNSKGIRTQKTQGDNQTTYCLDGTRILKEERKTYKNPNYVYSENEHNLKIYESMNIGIRPETLKIDYLYGTTGITGLILTQNSGEIKNYYYQKNIQGDIEKILDENQNIVAAYTYDAWGNHTITTNVNGIADINPFRYRGYYYDVETGLYLLTSRYYDPEVGRFINMDDISYLDPETINGLNLYAYCGNNPISRIDPTGNKWWHWLVGGAIILGAAALTVITAGGFAAAGTAIASIFTATMAPTAASAIFAGAFVGSLALGTAGVVIGGAIGSAKGVGFIEGASQGFMFGSMAGAVIGGAWGYSHYSLQAAGKMGVKVTSKNLNIVSNHVNSFGFDNANNAMLNRLSASSKVKGADARFFIHELKEAGLMAKGMPYKIAHAKSLAFYGHDKFGLYAKDVVRLFSSEFNEGFLKFWGL